MILREALVDWTDWDIAAYELGRSLSLFGQNNHFSRVKGVLWTTNPVGDSLREILKKLVEGGVLEYRDEPDDQYRWNPDFAGSWDR